MSEDKNELNQASKKQDSSNEKKLGLTDGAKPNKLETTINDEKKDTLPAESKKGAGDSNNKDPKLLDGEKTLSGLVIDHLDQIPTANVCVNLDGYKIETTYLEENVIRQVRVSKIY